MQIAGFLTGRRRVAAEDGWRCLPSRQALTIRTTQREGMPDLRVIVVHVRTDAASGLGAGPLQALASKVITPKPVST